jgi:hypothetical protein
MADGKKSQAEHRTTCGKIKKQRGRPVLIFMHFRSFLKHQILQVKLSEE